MMSDPTRRTVLASTGVLGAAAALAACSSGSGATGAAASGAGDASTQAPAPSTPQVLGPASDVPVQGGVVYDGPKVVVTQPTQGTIKAFSAVCTHQGCLVDPAGDNVLLCPCHGSKFSAADGSVLQGPAKTPLAPVDVTVTDGNVVAG